MTLRSHRTPEGPRIFASQDERDRFQRQKYDNVRNGYRQEWEPTDDRPLLIYSEPFWAGADEQAAWVRAVQSCPLSEYGHLDVWAYLAEVAKVATGLRGGVPTMPRPRMTRREMDTRLRELRLQSALARPAPGDRDIPRNDRAERRPGDDA